MPNKRLIIRNHCCCHFDLYGSKSGGTVQVTLSKNPVAKRDPDLDSVTQFNVSLSIKVCLSQIVQYWDIPVVLIV